jgi:hypothetical protein
MVFLLLLALLIPSSAFGQEQTGGAEEGDASLDEVLSGFEEEEAAPKTGEETEERPWDLSGTLSLEGAYNYTHDAPGEGETDYAGLQKLRLSLTLWLEYRFSGDWKGKVSGKGFYDLAYPLNGRGRYADEVLEEQEDEAEFWETYIQGSLFKNLDVKAGRQIVVWGKSDNIRVTDVLNPLDNREPGLLDIEDLRLPVSMTRLDYYLGRWSVTGIALHEIRFNKNPPFGSDFFPSDTPLPGEEIPTDTEFAVAINGMLTGWDVSFYWARLFDDQPHTELDSGGTVLRHSRITMLGAALDVARGNWLIKSEAAYFDGLEFFAVPGVRKSRLDLLLGAEYSGFADTTISLEAANRHINGYDGRIAEAPDSAERNDFITALRYKRDFMNQTLHLTLLALTFDLTGQGGALQRFSLKYDATDAISLTGGIVSYVSGNRAEFSDIGENDRVFLEARYSF